MSQTPPSAQVIHLAKYGGPYAGSFVPAVRALAGTVVERGWTFEIAFSPTARGRPWLRELEADGIPVSFVPERTWPNGFNWLVRRLRLDRRPTVLHSHFSGYDLMAAAASVSVRSPIVVFWHVHSRIRTEPLVRARNIVKYAVLGRAVDSILCVSPDIADAVRQRGARRRQVLFVPNAVDTTRFRPPTALERAEARRTLGLPMEANVVLQFGWDWDRKGGDIFLHAVKELGHLRGDEDLLAVTVGAGDQGLALISALGLDHVVRVLDARDDVWTFYAAADVFASPSRAEGMPYSMIEALGSGLRVVASDIPGQRLVGEDLPTCQLVALDAREVADGLAQQLDAGRQTPAEVQATRRGLGPKADLTSWGQGIVELYAESLSLTPQ